MRAHEIDYVVLARYMQILSVDFLKAWDKPIVNIHHSFLPAFIGARPYFCETTHTPIAPGPTCAPIAAHVCETIICSRG